MTNYNYNGMNAQDIANKIIKKEEAYENACYELMPFEVKCQYALELTPIIHPSVSPDRTRRQQLLTELRPELLRRAEREDEYALYVLGSVGADLSAPATDEERRFLERSMNAGYGPAALALLDRFYHGKKRSDPEAERILSWLAKRVGNDTPMLHRYQYYTLVGNKEKQEELATELAVRGDYIATTRLANSLGEVLDFDSDKRVFWETVEFLVLEHFYNNGATHLGDTLGMKLINERGCKRDTEKIKKIYVDLMFSYPYDRRQLLTIAGVPHNETGEDLFEAERICRLQIKDGRESNYWRLILIALLSGDREKVEAACDEASKAHDGLLSVNISKAYHMLRHADRCER